MVVSSRVIATWCSRRTYKSPFAHLGYTRGLARRKYSHFYAVLLVPGPRPSRFYHGDEMKFRGAN